MRVLFTTIPGSGHLHPLVPLARELRRRGHEVGFAAAPRFCAQVEACGLPVYPAGRDWLGSETTPAPDPASSLRRFVEVGGDMVGDLVSIAERFGAALLVREPAELGGWMAGELLGLPVVVHGVNVRWRRSFLRHAGREIGAQRSRHGLTPDERLSGFFGDVFLDVVPPSFQPERLRRLPQAHPLRPSGFDRSGPEGRPEWADGLRRRPLVYATLGTIFNRARPVLRTILEALSKDPVESS